MKSLLCPISQERIAENTVRITGFLITTFILCYLLFNWHGLLWIITLDYAIRAFTSYPYSPLSWLAKQISNLFQLPGKTIDKAPKIFAARVGFLFSFAGLILTFFFPMAANLVLGTLCLFAYFESVGNLCMGCLIYTYVIVKLYKIN